MADQPTPRRFRCVQCRNELATCTCVRCQWCGRLLDRDTDALRNVVVAARQSLDRCAALVSDLVTALTSVQAERDAALKAKGAAEATNKAWETQTAKANAAFEAAERRWAGAIALADSENPTVRALTEEAERLRDALEVIVGPEDRSPWLTPYREAGGGYEGLQAIAKAALKGTVEVPTLTERLEAVEAERDRYRDALRELRTAIVKEAGPPDDGTGEVEPWLSLWQIANAALATTPEPPPAPEPHAKAGQSETIGRCFSCGREVRSGDEPEGEGADYRFGVLYHEGCPAAPPSSRREDGPIVREAADDLRREDDAR